VCVFVFRVYNSIYENEDASYVLNIFSTTNMIAAKCNGTRGEHANHYTTDGGTHNLIILSVHDEGFCGVR
jgi:hypothetical protein